MRRFRVVADVGTRGVGSPRPLKPKLLDPPNPPPSHQA